MAKKRVYVYADEDKYAELKRLTSITGDTVAGIFDEAMTNYIEAINLILETKDKDALFDHFYKKMKDFEKEVEDNSTQVKK
jgi:hypothetical protein